MRGVFGLAIYWSLVTGGIMGSLIPKTSLNSNDLEKCAGFSCGGEGYWLYYMDPNSEKKIVYKRAPRVSPIIYWILTAALRPYDC